MIKETVFAKYFLLELANLEVDAKIGKDRHFAAADRKNKWRIFLGLFSVIGTALIASQAARDVLSISDAIKAHQTLIISIISLSVGISTAILGFLGLETQITQHRLVGNLYIEVARKARGMINRLYEGASQQDLRKEFDELLKEYLLANKEGESCPTSMGDSKRSLRQNEDARNKVKGKVKLQDEEALLYPKSAVGPRKLKLLTLVWKATRRKIAKALACFGLISGEEKDAYIKGLG